MRTSKLLFCLSLLSVNINFNGMQKPPAKASSTTPKPVVTADIKDDEDENAWFASLINLVSKKIDPLGYATDNKAIAYYHQALSYDPELEQPQTLNLDDTSKKVLRKIAPRIIAARKQLKDAVDSKDPDHKAIETLLTLYRQVPQVFSECDCAILFGLHNWRRNAHKRSVHELSYYRQTEQSADQSKSVILDSKGSKQELAINTVELRKLAEQKYNWWNPVELLAEGVHYLKKHCTHPIEHLTTVDSMKLCAGMAYFNPLHPLNSADPDYTLKPDLEWHRLLAKKVIDREDIHLANLIYNILRKRTANVMRLSEPVVATASSTVPPTIFSSLTKGLASGYLLFVQNSKIDSTPEDAKALEARRKEEDQRREAAAKKKADEEAETKKKAEEERLALLKRQEEELSRKSKEEAEIQRRAQELAQEMARKQRDEERKAEAVFRAAEEKQRAEREAEEKRRREESLKALESSDTSSSTSTAAPAVASGSPTSSTANAAALQSDVPTLEQNPNDQCKCGSKKIYKNCCQKKSKSSGLLQQP